jgi:hypothetical protein
MAYENSITVNTRQSIRIHGVTPNDPLIEGEEPLGKEDILHLGEEAKRLFDPSNRRIDSAPYVIYLNSHNVHKVKAVAEFKENLYHIKQFARSGKFIPNADVVKTQIIEARFYEQSMDWSMNSYCFHEFGLSNWIDINFQDEKGILDRFSWGRRNLEGKILAELTKDCYSLVETRQINEIPSIGFKVDDFDVSHNEVRLVYSTSFS